MDETLWSLVGRADDENPVTALRAAAELRRELNRLEAVQVRRARVRGVSWVEIARALGISKQAVHKKYGGSRFLPGSE